jgi:hypothetical protein
MGIYLAIKGSKGSVGAPGLESLVDPKFAHNERPTNTTDSPVQFAFLTHVLRAWTPVRLLLRRYSIID